MTLLSIIVPVYNTEPYLRRCLDSLLDQDLDPADVEIIVMNDGSPDNSQAILDEYASKHDNITVHSEPNRGLALVRNVALEEARGRYLFFVDSDDYIASQTLGALVRAACRENLQVLAMDHEKVQWDDLPAAPPVPVPDVLDVKNGPEFVSGYRYLSEATCYLYDRQLVLDLGARFDVGRIVEDVVFTATMVCAADRIARVPGPIYYYVQRPGSIMATVDDDHTRKLVVDYERVVVRIEEIRQSWLARGASPAFDRRLRVREQTFVFFLIARLLRTRLPVRSILPPVLDRLRGIGMYPMKDFPGDEFPGLQYRVLTAVFNRPYLLWPFATAVGLATNIAERLGR